MNIILFLMSLGFEGREWHEGWRMHKLIEILLNFALQTLLYLL